MTNGRCRVAVLMSTYNGEKYIREQIDSILAQKNVDVSLIIRDDGSLDRTETIIEDYCSRYENVVFLDDREHLGPGISFLKLLSYAYCEKKGYDFFSFADQDDIWLDRKLETAVEALKEKQSACLYCCNQEIYSEGSLKGLMHVSPPDFSFKGHLLKNTVSGCTFVLNRSLADAVVRSGLPDEVISEFRFHDAWIIMISLTIGEVLYDSNAYILYRIHDNNVVGLDKSKPLKQRVALLLSGRKKNLAERQAKFLLEKFNDIEQEKENFLTIVAGYRNSLSYKIKLISDKEVCSFSGENRLKFVIKILLNYL